MTHKARKKSSLMLSQARKELAEARMSGDQREVCLAAANVGLALFRVKKFQEGLRHFNEVDRIFNELNDFGLQVHCLGIKTMAYQITEQYPQAFQTAQHIEALAEARADLGAKSDSLATQGQILIDSGEEIFALEKLNAALAIAESIGDKRRQMKIIGALGNYCMTIASPERAESYFYQARALARELEDQQSEIGFHGNLGALLEWKGAYLQAGEIFDDVVTYMRKTGNQEAEIQALRHLVQVTIKLKDNERIAQYAQQGLEAAKESNDEILFFFYENLIGAYYRLNQLDDAHRVTTEAIAMARSANDRKREVDLLLNLGESYMLTNKLEKALSAYQQALSGTQRLQRIVDKAYLLGRIGIILAELNRTEEALRFHEQAIVMARKHALLDLEGEQLVMLAMAYLESGKLDEARAYGETAVQVYTKAGLNENAEKARQLLAEIGKTAVA